jgi:Protein of unknown function (DUF2786)
LDLDKDRLAKLLNLTESDQDGEALAAIRKANELLRQHETSWSAALGIVEPLQEPEAAPEAERPIYTPGARAAPHPPPGYQRARDYRNAFRREPLLPRILAFPFWIVVELLAIVAPRQWVNTRGGVLTAVFTLSMMLGILAWIGLGYYFFAF